jgi:hypothetical protein
MKSGIRIWIGKNTDFRVVWNFNRQHYKVYKNNKHLVTRYRWDDIKSYLN